MHDRAGNQELGSVNLTPRQGNRAGDNWGPHRRSTNLSTLLLRDIDRESQNARRNCIRIAQQRQTQMNINTLPRLGAARQFALETPFLENRSQRQAGEKRVLFNAIEVGNVSTDQFLWRKPISLYTLVTTGDDSLKISGEDRILQVVENARLNHGPTRRGRARESSAPSCGFRRSLRGRSLR